MNISDELVWSLVRSNTSFLHKRNGRTKRSGKIVLTSEPNNLMNLNSFKYSGLANSKAVGVTTAKDSKGRKCGELRLKSSKKAKTPSKSVGKTLLRKGYKACSSIITKQTVGTCYRPDLESCARRRWARVNLAINIEAGRKKPMKVANGLKKAKSS